MVIKQCYLEKIPDISIWDHREKNKYSDPLLRISYKMAQSHFVVAMIMNENGIQQDLNNFIIFTCVMDRFFSNEIKSVSNANIRAQLARSSAISFPNLSVCRV